MHVRIYYQCVYAFSFSALSLGMHSPQFLLSVICAKGTDSKRSVTPHNDTWPPRRTALPVGGHAWQVGCQEQSTTMHLPLDAIALNYPN